MAAPSSIKAMTKPKARRHVRTGNISEKIIAKAVFDLELVDQISNEQKPRIKAEGLKYLAKYFSAYVDNLARSNHRRYHHLYEPGYAGEAKYRLFAASVSEGKNPNLTFNFIRSRIPAESGYIFYNRAYVMENGIPLTIKPKNAKYLRFQYKGKFFTKKSVYVAEPGGPDVAGSFVEIFNIFMSQVATKALKEYGFFERIERGIEKESRIALARISAGKISDMAGDAAKSAKRIVKGLK